MNLSSPNVAPQYDGRCFANLPPTLEYWLTGRGAPAFAPELMTGFEKRYDLVILLFIDSLGWHFIERYAQEPFLKRFAREGRLAKMTSQFPPTTAAHVTCIHTGLPVGQSGVYEWQYYEPQLDAVILPLLFSFAGDSHRDTLAATGIAAETLFPTQTLYARLQADGVTSHTFGSREFTPSTYSSVVMRGAEMHSFKLLSEMLVNLGQTAATAERPAYLMLYYGDMDTMCHWYGPDSPQAHTEIELLLNALERWFMPQVRGKFQNALLVLTADHGHMAVTPQKTRYLNVAPDLKRVVPLLRTDAGGNVLPPAGSPRDPFLYVRDQALDEAQAILSKGLAGCADIVRTQELLAAGYFGPQPVGADLMGRLGNLVILPCPNECVWWYEEKRFEQKFFGQHGGLTPTEMEIPLGLLEL